jgi:hypothetical protein
VKKFIKVSMRPYPGTLYVTADRATFEKLHKLHFGEAFKIEKDDVGRSARMMSVKEKQTYLVYASTAGVLVHELVHVMTHVFDRIDIPMNDAGTETMAYFLDALFKDSVRIFEAK